MVNIDLKTDIEKPAVEMSADLSLAAIFIITAIVLAVWGGFYLWNRSLTSSISSADAQITQKSMDLSKRQDAKDVIDFQNRSKLAKGIVKEKNSFFGSLVEIEKKIVSGVYVGSFSYVKGVVNITVVANNYTIIAQQLANLKGSAVFSNVSAGSMSTANDGKVQMAISLNVN